MAMATTSGEKESKDKRHLGRRRSAHDDQPKVSPAARADATGHRHRCRTDGDAHRGYSPSVPQPYPSAGGSTLRPTAIGDAKADDADRSTVAPIPDASGTGTASSI